MREESTFAIERQETDKPGMTVAVTHTQGCGLPAVRTSQYVAVISSFLFPFKKGSRSTRRGLVLQ